MTNTALTRAYQAGLTIADVARRFGSTRSTVQRRLLAAGVRMRRTGPTLMSPALRVPTDAATVGYLAGLFDGEGNLYWRRRTGRANSARITIYNTCPKIMAWLARLGGFVRWDRKRVAKGWKPAGRWEVNRTRDCIALLAALLPHLVIKRAAAVRVLRDLRRFSS